MTSAGKTALGTALVAGLGITSLSIDDLKTAVQAITTPETHPKLHVASELASPVFNQPGGVSKSTFKRGDLATLANSLELRHWAEIFNTGLYE